MNNFLMFLIKICQLRIEIVCRAKRVKIFLKIFLLFECKKVQFGPQNIIWGLKNGGWGAWGPPGSATVIPYLKLKITKSKICRGAGEWGMGRAGCVVGLWSTTHTSGDGAAASVLNTQQRFVYMQRCRGSIPATPLRSQIIATLQKSHCVPW